ncbi:MAG: hypothetical protein ABI395_00460 [Sphingobium sp.]
MPSRRDLLVRGLSFGALATLGARDAMGATLTGKRSGPGSSGTLRGITGAHRRDDAIRHLGGLGDGYKMTLRPDGTQLVVVNDGPGWIDPPEAFFTTKLWTMSGGPDAPHFAPLVGYPDLNRSARPEEAPHYYGHGVIQVGERIHQFLSTLDRNEDRPRRWTGAKLIFSDDGGKTWKNQNGSSPVVWERWEDQSRDRLIFFGESGGCFSLLSILQHGPGQRPDRDGYIYLYGPNGSVDGLMNQLVLCRVTADKLTDRKSYRFFAGRKSDGSARWSADIAQRRPVHSFPRGWVNSKNLFPGDLVVESWLPSVVYNAPLGLYMMTNAGIGCGEDGTEFGKPSYFGVWVARTPWGQWQQIHEDAVWTPGGDTGARAYAPQIAPGWMSPDGRSFWIVWADLNGMVAFGRDEAQLDTALEKARNPAEHAVIETTFLRRYLPGFSFNAQQVDLQFE